MPEAALRVQAAAIRRLLGATFRAAGCSAEEAARIAENLVDASLAGHDSHGVIRVARYLKWMGEGYLVPSQTLSVVMENEVMAIADGNQGFGQTIGPQAVQLGMDKAAARGVSVIALRRSGHLGRIGAWAEMAAAAGLVSLHFVNVSGSVLVAPFGASERRMATNPLAIGVPMPDGPPLILDFATSVVAEGKLMVALTGGKPPPDGSLIDAEGKLSSDPRVFYGDTPEGAVPDPRRGTGALRAMGEHKGSGLSFMIEILAGALTGSGCSGPGPRPLLNGMLSVYLAPEVFSSGGEFAAEARQYVDFFKSARPAAPDGEVLVPGDPERRSREVRMREGLPFAEAAWRTILGAAREAGMSPEAIDAALA